jgi:hypothetical protein
MLLLRFKPLFCHIYLVKVEWQVGGRGAVLTWIALPVCRPLVPPPLIAPTVKLQLKFCPSFCRPCGAGFFQGANNSLTFFSCAENWWANLLIYWSVDGSRGPCLGFNFTVLIFELTLVQIYYNLMILFMKWTIFLEHKSVKVTAYFKKFQYNTIHNFLQFKSVR